MTVDPFWDWQEKMFIYSCWLYEYAVPVVTDDNFDRHCLFLLKKYDSLSQEFRDRVSKEQLQAGTGLGLIFTDIEIQDALNWKERVHGS